MQYNSVCFPELYLYPWFFNSTEADVPVLPDKKYARSGYGSWQKYVNCPDWKDQINCMYPLGQPDFVKK